MSRWFFFCLAIIVGICAGVYYGWLVKPVRVVDTAPAALRDDFKTDYVLMVAEAYSSDTDLEQSVRWLVLLGDKPPVDIVAEAIVYALEHGYSEGDLNLIKKLSDDMQTWNPSLEVPGP